MNTYEEAMIKINEEIDEIILNNDSYCSLLIDDLPIIDDIVDYFKKNKKLNNKLKIIDFSTEFSTLDLNKTYQEEQNDFNKFIQNISPSKDIVLLIHLEKASPIFCNELVKYMKNHSLKMIAFQDINAQTIHMDFFKHCQRS